MTRKNASSAGAGWIEFSYKGEMVSCSGNLCRVGSKEFQTKDEALAYVDFYR